MSSGTMLGAVGCISVASHELALALHDALDRSWAEEIDHVNVFQYDSTRIVPPREDTADSWTVELLANKAIAKHLRRYSTMKNCLVSNVYSNARGATVVVFLLVALFRSLYGSTRRRGDTPLRAGCRPWPRRIAQGESTDRSIESWDDYDRTDSAV